MPLIIADRVKETTTTQGTGTITLGGATFGGFQSFSAAIGEGNTTYYCIQNESKFEIGVGTYSSGTLSRDTVLKSSDSGSKISLVGVSVVFCVVASEKLLFKDENGDLSLPDNLNADYISAASGNFTNSLKSDSLSSTSVSANDVIASSSLNSSGLLTLRRESAGNFFHAYVDDINDRTISLYTDAVTPTWRLGLKNSPSVETDPPTYGYVYATDAAFGLIGNSNNQLTLSNTAPFTVKHQGVDVITAHYVTGVHLQSNSSAYPALIVNGGAALSADIQRWDNNAGTTLSVVNNEGNFGVRNSNPSYQLDVTGTGSFSQAVRFGDGTLQTTAGIPYASGSLIDQNAANLISQSGYFQSYVDIRDTAISGNLQSQINQNVSDISATSGYFESRVDSADATAISHSGYFESRVDSADSSITANSGYFESRVDSADSSITANSGYFESRVDSADSSITANSGYFESRVDTNAADIVTVSGLTGGNTSLPLASGAKITANTNLINSVSGWAGSTITNEVASLVDSAPGTLDTLNELAAAINDDANIASTLTTLISNTSGNLQSQITSNDTDILTVSGLLYNDASLSGYFEGRADSNQTNIATNTTSINTVSGLIPNNTFNITAGDGSNYTIDGMGLNSASDPTMYMHKGHTYILNKTFSGHPFRVSATDGGSVYSDADSNNIEIGSAAGSVTFEVPQNAPDKLYYYCTAHPSNMKGLIYTTTDGAISGYFESRVDDNQSNISTNTSNIATKLPAASGAVITAVSGYFESRVDSADSNISTNSSSITANSGYFESRVDTNAADIATVSGLTSGGSQNLFSTISVAGQSDVEADATTDTLTLVAGSNMTITTNAASDTITFTSSGGGGGGGGAVSAVTSGVDNRVATFSGTDTLNGEQNLTFDGSTLAVNGAFTATTKSFLIDHPTKEGMKLQYASLEGPENGIYIRGTSGSNIITLPDYWSTLVDQSTVTVTLTPIGFYQALYIKEKGKNYIKVGGSKGSYDYVVYGERKDVEKLKVEW